MTEEENRQQLRIIATLLFGVSGTNTLKEATEENELDYEDTIFEAIKEIMFNMGLETDGSDILISKASEITSLIRSFDYIETFEEFFQIEDGELIS